jgi:TATA-binding protein-associated factor Taf7
LKAGLIKTYPSASRTGHWRLNHDDDEEEEEEDDDDDDDNDDNDDKMYASVTSNTPRRVHKCTDVILKNRSISTANNLDTSATFRNIIYT